MKSFYLLMIICLLHSSATLSPNGRNSIHSVNTKNMMAQAGRFVAADNHNQQAQNPPIASVFNGIIDRSTGLFVFHDVRHQQQVTKALLAADKKLASPHQSQPRNHRQQQELWPAVKYISQRVWYHLWH
ncbi:hypothetical protein [Motilimonas pumila]|uniref:Uncharacterized protein n=1 Tax=Motilimonas pumila TaxID=2303987 RepID=A0A418YIL2_9GAMM|nr:hypothetical protein [Motilimonas pumila]RJG50486.1 hypothetical protein D1Z90_03125 [Motilimonas pumila]